MSVQAEIMRTTTDGILIDGTPKRSVRLSGWIPVGLALTLLLIGVIAMTMRLAGFQYIFTRGQSMEPTISAGSLLIARKTAPDEIRTGDIVGFSASFGGGASVVHRVAVLETGGGHPVAMTMGDNNPVPDPEQLVLNRPVARVVWMAPRLGWIINPNLGWVLLVIGAVAGLRALLSSGRLDTRRPAPALSR